MNQPMDDPVWRARVDLAAAYRLAVRHDFHEGVINHFSLAVPGTTDRFLINRYGLHFSEVTAGNLLVLDSEATVVEGEGTTLHTGFYIHSRIHLARPEEAACVLHTHMPYATALAALDEGWLEPISQTALTFWGRVAYDRGYNGEADSIEEGDRIAKALGDACVLFLGNHGVIATGPTVAEAWDNLYTLERACELQVLAMSTGRPLHRVTDEVAERYWAQLAPNRAHDCALHFEAAKRMLDREEPDYAT